METLFNIDFEEINVSGLTTSLLESSLSSVTEEDNIIAAIESSQYAQNKILSTAWCFYEEIYKYSSSDISVSIDKAIISGIPTVEGRIIDINPVGTELVSGLLSKGGLRSSFGHVFWRFFDIVMIQNDMYSNTSSGGRIMATVEAKAYYFLIDSPGETLHQCSLSSIGPGETISSIDDDMAINYIDAKNIYLNKSSSLNLAGKKLHNNETKIAQDNITSGNANIQNQITVSGATISNGAITKSNKSLDFIHLEESKISNSASVKEDIPGNYVTLIEATTFASENKAPYEEWGTNNLIKNSFKSSAFLLNFVEILLSGEAIPENSLSDFHSLVTKQELTEILDLIAIRILDMDICDDN